MGFVRRLDFVLWATEMLDDMTRTSNTPSSTQMKCGETVLPIPFSHLFMTLLCQVLVC